jgi:L-amino acid N-acyltransferase YncA
MSTIRPSRPDDLEAITAIYAHAVSTGTGSFEIDPPNATEMARRRLEVLAHGLPYLVAEAASGIQGYAYATPFRPRPAYRFSVEDSVYVHAGARGQGVGALLLAELIARCTDWGARQMLAVIGDSANHGSVALHERLGFKPAGRFENVGYKFGSWLDIVLMQRTLGLGATLPPTTETR